MQLQILLVSNLQLQGCEDCCRAILHTCYHERVILYAHITTPKTIRNITTTHCMWRNLQPFVEVEHAVVRELLTCHLCYSPQGVIMSTH
jgi:hypothetical protein